MYIDYVSGHYFCHPGERLPMLARISRAKSRDTRLARAVYRCGCRLSGPLLYDVPAFFVFQRSSLRRLRLPRNVNNESPKAQLAKSSILLDFLVYPSPSRYLPLALRFLLSST